MVQVQGRQKNLRKIDGVVSETLTNWSFQNETTRMLYGAGKLAQRFSVNVIKTRLVFCNPLACTSSLLTSYCFLIKAL